MSRIEQYIAQLSGGQVALNLIDRKFKLKVDGEFYLSIIRPTSGAVETENSLVNNELSKFWQQVASVHRSKKEVEKEVLTAACNAVEFASRLREIASASG
ncbi:hypothetical protein [Pseudomonas orientalis]|uniref:hypothetical protein n=1 Tax=Pseudomonas orientalis TaxID=76758 RepID=UPI0013DD92CC|nr:hypothetical protein [Pseudomonas orientalis]